MKALVTRIMLPMTGQSLSLIFPSLTKGSSLETQEKKEHRSIYLAIILVISNIILIVFISSGLSF